MTSGLLADCGQGLCGGDSFRTPCPQHVSDRGSEPGPHAEVDNEVDGGVGHFTHVGKGLDDEERIAELEQRAGHRESDEHWIGFKGDVGETSERCGGAHMDFFESMDTILNRTELTRRQRQPLLVLLTTTSQQLRRSSGEGRHT